MKLHQSVFVAHHPNSLPSGFFFCHGKYLNDFDLVEPSWDQGEIFENIL
jgi:hypothetical protein